ncbi:MAG: methyltransferase, partial [Promethearchaeota archaeon]
EAGKKPRIMYDLSRFTCICVGLLERFKLLGLKRSLCLNFFKDDVPIVQSSLYKYIKNPEDVGLWTMLIGFVLLTGSIYNLIIAIEFIVIMIPHERVENMPLKTV